MKDAIVWIIVVALTVLGIYWITKDTGPTPKTNTPTNQAASTTLYTPPSPNSTSTTATTTPI